MPIYVLNFLVEENQTQYASQLEAAGSVAYCVCFSQLERLETCNGFLTYLPNKYCTKSI